MKCQYFKHWKDEPIQMCRILDNSYEKLCGAPLKKSNQWLLKQDSRNNRKSLAALLLVFFLKMLSLTSSWLKPNKNKQNLSKLVFVLPLIFSVFAKDELNGLVWKREKTFTRTWGVMRSVICSQVVEPEIFKASTTVWKEAACFIFQVMGSPLALSLACYGK